MRRTGTWTAMACRVYGEPVLSVDDYKVYRGQELGL